MAVEWGMARNLVEQWSSVKLLRNIESLNTHKQQIHRHTDGSLEGYLSNAYFHLSHFFHPLLEYSFLPNHSTLHIYSTLLIIT